MGGEWRRCPDPMARRARDRVACLWRSSAGWMPARTGRLSPNAGRRHPFTVCKASWMTRTMRRLWALRHQAGALFSAVEWTRVRVAVRNVIASGPHPEPAIRLKSATRDVIFLPVTEGEGDTWESCSKSLWWYLGSEQKGRVSLLWLSYSSRLNCLVVEMDDCLGQ